MSYSNMWAEEDSCDFPGCNENFDHSKEAICALIDKDGKIRAFCKKHCDRLTAENAPLRLLSDIHAELKEAEEAPRREAAKREQLAREAAFIAGLKKRG